MRFQNIDISTMTYFCEGIDGRGNISHISFKNLIQQKHNTFCIKLILDECLSLALKELKRVCFLAFELYS